ncbi:MAG: SDR family oxidoreductase [Geminicoccaceae bacterium]|nr:MAG: SDR family oxidoreductase [Geminicoccaceae bacterium]
MDLGLTGKRAVVFAGTRGLGRGIAQALAGEGAVVMVAGRNDAEGAAAEIAGASGGRVQGFSVDLYERSGVDTLLDHAETTLGGIDVLVLNGGGPPPAPALEIDAAGWALWFERMVANLVHAANRTVPAMCERGWGRLLTVSSSAALAPLPTMALSNSLRAGLIAWNKTLAGEIAAKGVTCNMIVPGRIQTERVDALDAAAAKRQGTTPEAVRQASVATIPVGRYGTIEEFGAVGAFLCSAQASYLTGSAIRVDGGLIRAL